MTREETSKIVSLLQEVYPGFRSYQSPTAPAAWYIALEHLTYEQVRTAVIDIIREGQIKPSPADVAKRYPTPTKAAEPQRCYTYSADDYYRMLNYFWPDIPAKYAKHYDGLLEYRRRHGHDT